MEKKFIITSATFINEYLDTHLIGVSDNFDTAVSDMTKYIEEKYSELKKEYENDEVERMIFGGDYMSIFINRNTAVVAQIHEIK